jgi:hypothetical protein
MQFAAERASLSLTLGSLKPWTKCATDAERLDAVSRAYGARKCGTPTPSAFRPGRISDALREDSSAPDIRCRLIESHDKAIAKLEQDMEDLLAARAKRQPA